MKQDVPDARAVFPEWTLKEFSRLLSRRAELKAIMAECEEELGYTDSKKVRHKGIDDDIERMLTDHNTPKLVHDGIPVTLSQSSRSTLSKELLAEHGVAASVIAACTKVTTFTVLRIGSTKEAP